MSKQYVQHKSGVGEKWELAAMQQSPNWKAWVAPHNEKDGGLLYLPKSEYLICEPPEEWRDVTGRLTAGIPGNFWQYWNDGGPGMLAINNELGYRLRKVPVVQVDHIETRSISIPYSVQWAFIVEKKVSA